MCEATDCFGKEAMSTKGTAQTRGMHAPVERIASLCSKHVLGGGKSHHDRSGALSGCAGCWNTSGRGRRNHWRWRRSHGLLDATLSQPKWRVFAHPNEPGLDG